MRTIISFFLFLVSVTTNAQFKNQNEILAKYTSGNYTVYRNDQGKLDKVNKQWPIAINKSGGKDMNGNDLTDNVLVKRAGVVDETFVPDLKEQPGYFSYDANKLIFFEDCAVYYKQTNSSYNSSVSYEVLYEFVPEGGNSKSLKGAAEDIAAYRAATLNSQSGTRQDIAKNKEATEAKEKEENSTKGKSVKSLTYQAVDIPAELGLMSKLKFGVIATLADGTQLKTKNLGGKTDFDDSYIVEAPGCIFADGVLEVGFDAAAFPTDEILLTIKNKNNPSQSISEKITLAYESPFFTYSSGNNSPGAFGGASGSNNCPTTSGRNGNSGNDGSNGGDITIKIKETKHKKTGATIYQMEIFKARENQTIRFKTSASANINIICNGGSGGDGGDGGRGGKSSNCGESMGGAGGAGGRGGRGGNVTIVKSSPSINTSFIKINNAGGNGGRGGAGGRGSINGASGNAGSNGSDGALNTNSGAVNLNW